MISGGNIIKNNTLVLNILVKLFYELISAFYQVKNAQKLSKISFIIIILMMKDFNYFKNQHYDI